MLLKKVTLAALAGTVLLATAPAFADRTGGTTNSSVATNSRATISAATNSGAAISIGSRWSCTAR